MSDFKSSVKLRALYSLYPPLKVDTDASVKLYDKFFVDFASGKLVPIRGTFVHDGEFLAVTARRCTASQKKRYFKEAPFLRVGDTILEFSATFNFPRQEQFFVTDPTGTKVVQTIEEAVATWKSHLPLDLELTIQNYLCFLTIAYPGAVRPTGNIWLLDGSPYGADHHYVSQIHESIEYLRENNALPTVDVTTDEVIRWCYAQNGMFDGYSDTPASRALNYFTRLFTREFRNDELSDLVWAIAGIEALLVQGGRSSLGQLRDKLIAIFGAKIEAAWLSKMISDSYNFRSRMIHGDRQIRSSFRVDDEDSKKRFDEEYDSKLFSIGILERIPII